MASREGPHVRPATRGVRRLPVVALRRVLLIVLSAVVALLAVNACSSSAKSGTAGSGTLGSSMAGMVGAMATTPSSAQEMIHIENFRFRTPASVSPGAAVQVMNMDGEAHTVTSDATGGFQLTVPAGATLTLTAPTKPGRYPFHCDFHANMHGLLVVG
jgi:plastocyanin